MKSDNSSNSRRKFLGKVGGATTATLATRVLGLPASIIEANAQAPNKRVARADQALRIRIEVAQEQRRFPFAPQPVNGDEELYPNGIAGFSKSLPHNELGEVNQRSHELLLNALNTCRHDEYEIIPMGGSQKLANPQAALAFELVGADSHQLSIPAPPSFNCMEQAAEMVELYWQALTRDVHFSGYSENNLTNLAALELSRLSGFHGSKINGQVTALTLFRGNILGDIGGPYLSQFLYHDIPYGAMNIQQRYRVPQPESDHLVKYEEWLSIQNGTAVTSSNWLGDNAVYLRNGRDLAGYAHKNFSYQPYLNAALIMLGWGEQALDQHNPYNNSATQTAFCTFGGPYILDLVARAANNALKASWYQKWQLHRRIRPEEFGGRVHNHTTRAARYDIHPEVLNASVLEIIHNKHESYLLPQAYPEGCPAHPAYPSGHATVAGACVTILKAFFNENFVIPNPVAANTEGTALDPLSGPTLKVGTELNKLAANISFGLNFAGIHWRSDCVEGMKLGEVVALAVLTDLKATCHEQFKGFRLTKFDGTTIIV